MKYWARPGVRDLSLIHIFRSFHKDGVQVDTAYQAANRECTKAAGAQFSSCLLYTSQLLARAVIQYKAGVANGQRRAGIAGLDGADLCAVSGIDPVSYTHLDVYKRQFRKDVHRWG